MNDTDCRRRFLVGLGLLLSCGVHALGAANFRAGASVVDITPPTLPVIRNGGFVEGTLSKVEDRLQARCLVLDDGSLKLAIVVVDSCMVPREVCDQAKAQAARQTGIAARHILISATHTHSAPSVMNYCLGTRADPAYTKFLPGKIAQAIAQAAARLQPARAGWAVADAGAFAKNRRWITRPDKMLVDPFGERTVRAMMHPGYQNPAYTGESGPIDPWLSVLSLQTEAGQPLAVLANFAMHYFSGHAGVSADYFGLFATMLGQQLAPGRADFVGIMSQGTSGDIWRADYSQPKPPPISMTEYTARLVNLACEAYAGIEYRTGLTLDMVERHLTLRRRVPSASRLAWAKQMLAGLGGGRPRNRPEVYAEQAVFLHEHPTERIVLQAIRIGELGLTAIPNEVYALTGLKLKARSPLQPTINMELANGASGYIPPPEQHLLGGYNTWPARTAGLEVQAEPKITEALLGLLEEVSGKPRRPYREPVGAYARAVLRSGPEAYWRLGDQSGPVAADATGKGHSAEYESGVAFHLPGVSGPAFGAKYASRAAHFAGGRLQGRIEVAGADYSVEFWLWNAMPNAVRSVTGYVFSRSHPASPGAPGDHLGIGGTQQPAAQGKLILFNGNKADRVLVGRTALPLRQWHHVVFTRHGSTVRVYLNGDPQPEIAGELEVTFAPESSQFWIGGRSDGLANFEGRLDEVALFDRALAWEEIASHYQTCSQP